MPHQPASVAPHRRSAYLLAATVVTAGLSVALGGCPAAPKKVASKPTTVLAAPSAEGDARWHASAARGQSVYVKLDLPVVVAGATLTLYAPQAVQQAAPGETQPATQPSLIAAPWPGGKALEGAEVLSSRVVRGTVEGPAVEQLTGEPRAAADGGSYLVAAPGVAADAAGAEAKVFTIKEPFPLYLRLSVPQAVEPGEYRFPIRIQAPGRPEDTGVLALEVPDLAVPAEPRVLPIVTTSLEHLAAIYPQDFQGVTTNTLDRENPEHAAAIGHLDALIQAAKGQGVALFAEDLAPVVRVAESGAIVVDWDAYDRVMGPFMDGSAFADHQPQPLWLAPLAPRRIRETPTQLRQYMESCVQHHRDKGWVGTPVFYHPALAESGASRELQSKIAQLVKLHLPREWAAVMPVDGSYGDIPVGQVWQAAGSVGGGDDPRVPPVVGGHEAAIRAWPWVCAARGVKGLLWRDAVASVQEVGAGKAPLLVVGEEVMPSLRMAWLGQGLNDAALLGLLEKRTAQGVTDEVLAGMVGRTGLSETQGFLEQVVREQEGFGWPLAPRGYLYSGWPQGVSVWGQVTPMLTKLVLANDPGTRGKMSAEDPTWLAAKVWLAENRRPVGRITGYAMNLRAGRQTSIIDARVEMTLENPIAAGAEFNLKVTQLPGDFEVAPAVLAEEGHATGGGRLQMVTMEASSAKRLMLPLAGHTDALVKGGETSWIEMTERHGGASMRLPLRVPVYRAHLLGADEDAPKLDGRAVEWAGGPQRQVFGDMMVGMRYATRGEMLGGALREDAQPATAQWVYDQNYLYVLVRCPQNGVTDERNTEWPVVERRWWGSDGVQVLVGDVGVLNGAGKGAGSGGGKGSQSAGWGGGKAPVGGVVRVGFKPSGVQVVDTARVEGGKVVWREGGPVGVNGNVKYGIAVEKKEGRVTGWVVEAAIPRAWVSGKVEGVEAPAWRVNVLRHRAGDLASMSWSGPVVDDEDVGMMGMVVGE